MSTELQVVHVSVENILGIREADLSLGEEATVYGDNGAGKTSLHRAIAAALEGAPGEIIRLGQEQGRILLRLAGGGKEYEIQRKVGKGKGLKVDALDGETRLAVRKPQAFLDGLLGDLSFDPAAFALRKPKEQIEAFTRAFPVSIENPEVKELAQEYGVDPSGHGLEALQALTRALEEHRRNANRAIRAEGELLERDEPLDIDALPDPEGVARATEAAQASRDALMRLDADNDAIRARNGERSSLGAQIRANEARILELQRAVEEDRERLARLGEAEEALDRVEAEAAAHRDQEELEVAKSAHRAGEAAVEWRERQELHQQKLGGAAELSARIDLARGPWLRELMDQIEIPVDGLAITGEPGSETLTLDDVPIADVNTEKKIRVGMAIAAALNRDRAIKIVAIDDAEHLTRKNRALLADEAKRAGFQILMLIAADSEDVPQGELEVRDGVVQRAGEGAA